MANSTVTYSVPLTETERVTAGVATAIIGFAATIGNGVVFCAFCKFRKLRTPTNFFILNLAVFDFLVGCLPLSFWASYLLTGKPRRNSTSFDFVYWLWEGLDVLCGFGSATSLSFIAVDRYICIKDALRYHSLVTATRVNVCLALIWLYSLIPVGLSYLKTTGVISGAVFRYYIFIAGLVIQVCVMAFCYLNIFLETVRLSRQMQKVQRLGKFSTTVGAAKLGYGNSHADMNSSIAIAKRNDPEWKVPDSYLENSHSVGQSQRVSGVPTRDVSLCRNSGWDEGKTIHLKSLKTQFGTHRTTDSSEVNGNKAAELKAARTLSFIMGAFLLTWTPFIATVVLFQWQPKLVTFKLSVVTKCLHYSNSGVNPFLYTVLNKNFRKAIISLLLCRSSRSKDF